MANTSRIVAAVTNSDLMKSRITSWRLPFFPYRPLSLQGPRMSSAMNSALLGTKTLKVDDPTF